MNSKKSNKMKQKKKSLKSKAVSAVKTIVRLLKYFAKRIRQKFCEHRLEYKTKPIKQFGTKTLTACRCRKCGRSFSLSIIIPHDYLEEGIDWEGNSVTELYEQKAT